MLADSAYKQLVPLIQNMTSEAVQSLYAHEVDPQQVVWNETRKEFEGEYTVVVFPYTKAARKKPEMIAEEMGEYFLSNSDGVIEKYNVVKGFLNLVVSDDFWKSFLKNTFTDPAYGTFPKTGKKVMVEFASPNTNKPLHLGHIRNILLGWSCSQILNTAGHEVLKMQIINDRGIAICKSMLAWQKYGEGKTPESTGTKSDHFVGDYYVLFEQKFKEEYKGWQVSEEGQKVLAEKKKETQTEAEFFKAYKNFYFNNYSTIGGEARDMLLKWEANDDSVRQLWSMMNSWVYDGFEITYDDLGVSFDKLYYESDTYLLGKSYIEQGLEDGIFYKKENGSVCIDLTDAKLDEKVVLRSDGTSLYVTQDIGTAQLRYEDYQLDQMVYVVADEQNYHFQTLFEIMKRLKAPYANDMHHLSYGMVDLPSGRMKSREGTVVDADDLMADVINEARKNIENNGGDILELPEEELNDTIRKIGLAALKYFIIKVNPQKRMVFNPEESVDMQGQTGPYIQYSYVRIKGVLQRAEQEGIDLSIASQYDQLQSQESALVKMIYNYPSLIQQAANNLDPSVIATYCYDLAKAYHKFWHDLAIFNDDEPVTTAFRLALSRLVGEVLAKGMKLLGIEMPNKM